MARLTIQAASAAVAVSEQAVLAALDALSGLQQPGAPAAYARRDARLDAAWAFLPILFCHVAAMSPKGCLKPSA